jgi:hypothetical protein
LCKESGVFRLPGPKRSGFLRSPNSRQSVEDFFLQCSQVERCLDVVETVFSTIERVVAGKPREFSSATPPDDAIAELNSRFREHGVGYEFRSGQIIRVDSQLVHKEVVVPAFGFLQQRFLAGANEEFLSAHEHYRHGRCKECLVDCLKAFESTMKAICDKRRWGYPANPTAKRLIEVCVAKGLFPSFMESHLSGLRSTLESGLPTIRNKLGGHGQGSTPVEVSEEVASYALHLTATNILLVASSDAKLK